MIYLLVAVVSLAALSPLLCVWWKVFWRPAPAVVKPAAFRTPECIPECLWECPHDRPTGFDSCCSPSITKCVRDCPYDRSWTVQRHRGDPGG